MNVVPMIPRALHEIYQTESDIDFIIKHHAMLMAVNGMSHEQAVIETAHYFLTDPTQTGIFAAAFATKKG